MLRNGEHVVQLNVLAKNGEVLEYRFEIEVRKSEEDDEEFGIRRRMTPVETDIAGEVLESLGHRPKFRLLLRLCAALDLEQMLGTLGSLRDQVYRDWSLQILAPDVDTSVAVRVLIAEAAPDLEERIGVLDPSDEVVGAADRP